MSDDNRADPNAEEIELADEDRLPWLEAVEEDQDEGGPSVAKLVAAILIGLVAIGVIVGGLYWLGNRGQPGAGNEVITAEKGDYKQRPQNPGGFNPAGEGNTSLDASRGGEPKGNINLNGVAEPPVTPGQPVRPPAPAPAPQPVRPAPGPVPAPAPAASGPAIQIGSFASPAQAESVWRELSGRFRYLAPLAHRVVAARVDGRTYHRLQAIGPNALDVCRRLRAAGEQCIPAM